MFKGFKAVGIVYGVVVCKDNGKVGGCGDGCIASSGGYKVVVVMWVFGWIGGMGGGRRERTPTRALPRQKSLTSDTILTDAHTLIIHKTIYLILVFETIYQVKKIG